MEFTEDMDNALFFCQVRATADPRSLLTLERWRDLVGPCMAAVSCTDWWAADPVPVPAADRLSGPPGDGALRAVQPHTEQPQGAGKRIRRLLCRSWALTVLGLWGASWQEEVLRLNPLPLLVGIVMKADAEPRQLVRG